MSTISSQQFHSPVFYVPANGSLNVTNCTITGGASIHKNPMLPVPEDLLAQVYLNITTGRVERHVMQWGEEVKRPIGLYDWLYPVPCALQVYNLQDHMELNLDRHSWDIINPFDYALKPGQGNTACSFAIPDMYWSQAVASQTLRRLGQ